MELAICRFSYFAIVRVAHRALFNNHNFVTVVAGRALGCGPVAQWNIAGSCEGSSTPHSLYNLSAPRMVRNLSGVAHFMP
jgi:hypothetical protein